MRTGEAMRHGLPPAALACDDDQCRELMVRYQAGKSEAFGVLYEQLAPLVGAYGDAIAPECRADFVEEVFRAIHQLRRSYDPRGSFAAWAAAIIEHVLSTRGGSFPGTSLGRGPRRRSADE